MASAELKAELRQLLDRHPRYPLGFYPTPLEEVPRFSEQIGGPCIFLKRDDMTGLAFGGNKARNLDYFIGEAKAQGCDVLIAGGGAVQSNHARMCAAAARKAGMLPVILVRAGTKHYELQGNYLLTKMLVGEGIYLVDAHASAGTSRPPAQTVMEVKEKLARELRSQGYKPYVMPGSAQHVGPLGYVACALELAEQCQGMGLTPDWVFITSAAGGQAGLLVGSKFLRETYRVVGISPYARGTRESRANSIAERASSTAKLLGIDLRIDADEVVNYDYGSEAYGVLSPECVEAIDLLMRTEGVFLDPVYSSKGMAGLIDQIRQGTVGSDDTVIFVHTGGLPAIFAYSPELAEEFGLSLEADHMV